MKTKLSSLPVRRRQLQHSADGEYPFNDPANAGLRREAAHEKIPILGPGKA